MKKLIAYIFISFAICIYGCRKEAMKKKELPPITQEGKNTFGCKVNGEVWIPDFKCRFFTDPCEAIRIAFLSAFPPSILPIGIGLNARKELNNSSSYFHIGTKYIYAPPATYITGVGNIYDSLDIEFSDDATGIFYKMGGRDGLFEISKLDTTSKIIAGTFNFTLSNGADSVVITDGRFDLKLEGYCHCD
jgi:hypothetical protein